MSNIDKHVNLSFTSATKALVVHSGGQDSTTCLGLAIHRHGKENVEAISFIYGQKHEVELRCASEVCEAYGIRHKIVDLSFFGKMVTSALTSDGDVNQEHAYKKDLPASFVPNRNALFLTVAHARAQEIGAEVVYTGVCQTDYSGYPDCRADFITSLEHSLNVGYETSITFNTPLMHLTKAETFELAQRVHFLEVVLEHSHTCYNGDHTTRNDWGFGCGECPACELRAKGYQEFMMKEELR